MEVAGAATRQVAWLPGAVDSTGCSSFHFAGAGTGTRFLGRLRMGCPRPRKACGALTHEFSDRGHLQYYYEPPTCVCKKSMAKQKGKEIKKKIKLLKGLSKDLSKFSGMRFGLDTETGLVGDVQGTRLSEAAELLLKQLEQLRAEEKELRKKRKEEKAKMKAMKMNETMMKSSSSSESSDDDCGEVIDMSSMRNHDSKTEALAPPILHHFQADVRGTETPMPTIPVSTPSPMACLEDLISGRQEGCCGRASTSCSNLSGVKEEACVGSKRIEVCMGGKCKKSGGAALLEEFQREMGVEGAVVGCKCMGKCKEGPNVRIRSFNDAEKLQNSVRTPSNPLCLGVALQDVGNIVSNFFGDTKGDLGLAPAS